MDCEVQKKDDCSAKTKTYAFLCMLLTFGSHFQILVPTKIVAPRAFHRRVKAAVAVYLTLSC